MSSMNFLIAGVIWFVSGTMITFSQGDAAKIKSKQLSEIGSRTKHGESAFISKNIEQTDKTNTLDAFVDELYYFIFWK